MAANGSKTISNKDNIELIADEECCVIMVIGASCSKFQHTSLLFCSNFEEFSIAFITDHQNVVSWIVEAGQTLTLNVHLEKIVIM